MEEKPKTSSTPSENTTKEEREEILALLNEAKQFLLEEYGVDNLSTAEGIKLRQLIEEYKRRKEKEARKLSRDKDWAIDYLAVEAVLHWLLELYGVNVNDLKRGFSIKDKKTGEIYRYTTEQKEEFHSKLKELEQIGHPTWGDYGAVDPRDIEYIRRLREKAHLI